MTVSFTFPDIEESSKLASQRSVSSHFIFVLYTTDCVSTQSNQFVVNLLDDTVILSWLTSTYKAELVRLMDLWAVLLSYLIWFIVIFMQKIDTVDGRVISKMLGPRSTISTFPAISGMMLKKRSCIWISRFFSLQTLKQLWLFFWPIVGSSYLIIFFVLT